MRDSELYFAKTFCWQHNIYVVVKVVKSGLKYRLAISKNGRETLGNQIYENTPQVIQKSEIVYGRRRNYTVTIPSVHKRIDELYLEMYRENTQLPKIEKLQETA